MTFAMGSATAVQVGPRTSHDVPYQRVVAFLRDGIGAIGTKGGIDLHSIEYTGSRDHSIKFQTVARL